MSVASRIALQGGNGADERSSMVSSRASLVNPTSPAFGANDSGSWRQPPNGIHNRVSSGPLLEDPSRAGLPVNGSADPNRQSAGSSFYRGQNSQSNGSAPVSSVASPSSRNFTDSTLVNSPNQPRRPPRSPHRGGEGGFEENGSIHSEDAAAAPAMFAPVGFPVGTYLSAEAAAASSVPGKFVRQLDVDAPAPDTHDPRNSVQLLAARSGLVPEKDKSARKSMLPKFGFSRKKSAGPTLQPDQASFEREPRKSMTMSAATQFLRGKKSQNGFEGSMAAGLVDAPLPSSVSSSQLLSMGERPRAVSTTLDDRLPPRSSSVMGILSRDAPSSLARMREEEY